MVNNSQSNSYQVWDFTAYGGRFWPGRELAVAAPYAVRETLTQAGIGGACVALMEGPWYRDTRAANEALAELIARERDFFVPLACVDPSANYAAADLRHAVNDLGFAGVRLYPTYHHYFLDDEGAIDLARAAADFGVPVFVTLMIEEDRFAHPAVRTYPLVRPNPGAPKRERTVMHIASGVEERPIPPLIELLRRAPETTFVVSEATVDEAYAVLRRSELGPERIFFDTGRMDRPTVGLDCLVEQVGHQQLVLGTNAPFFYPEGALMGLMYRRFDEQVSLDILAHNYAASAVLARTVAKTTQYAG
jgi:predicted TIM-barrel fold metal-dependent hydrolase